MYKLLNKTYKDSSNLKINIFIDEILNSKVPKVIITSNPETYMESKKNSILYKLMMDKNTIIIPDSVGTVYGIKKVLNKNVKKYPGVELLENILMNCNKNNKKVYLYGATEDVNKKMEEYIKNKFSNIKIVGRTNGYKKNKKEIIEKIVKAKADFIPVALGIPNQELFINDLKKELKKGLLIGVGGSFDTITEHTKRAPKIFINLNLEWLYRIVKEPKRIKRFYKNNIRFLFKIYFLK